MAIPNSAGIYLISNSVNGHGYVGSARNLRKRWNRHLSELRLGKHFNTHLQRAFNKYGEAAFTFEILCFCPDAHLIYFEQFCIDLLKPKYNQRKLAESMLGHKHTEEARRNMSVAHLGQQTWLGKTHTKETREKMSHDRQGVNNLVGVPKTEITKLKIARTLKGNQNARGARSPEARQRIRDGIQRAKLTKLQGRNHE